MHEVIKTSETEPNQLEVDTIVDNISQEKTAISENLGISAEDAEKVFDNYIVESAEAEIENVKNNIKVSDNITKNELLGEVAVESVLEISSESPEDTVPASTIIVDGYGEQLEDSIKQTGLGNKILNGFGIGRVVNSIKSRIDNRYTDKERNIVNNFKTALEDGTDTDYFGTSDEPTSSTLVKAFRLATGTKAAKKVMPNLYSKNLRDRENEARFVADKEFGEEIYAKRQTINDLTNKKSEEAIERRRKKNEELEKEKAELDQERQNNELIDRMEDYRKLNINGLQAERAQEISEKAFNEKLTKLTDIEIEAEIEGSDVQKREIEYDGKKITIFDLKGFPFATLRHAIDYRGRGDFEHRLHPGVLVSQELQNNPSIWAEKRDYSIKYGGEGRDTKGNTISMSYINTESTFRSIDSDQYYYGFDNVRPDSILKVTEGDGMTYNGVGDAKRNYIDTRSSFTPDQLEKPKELALYNEIQVRRYDEQGTPTLPDFVIIKNGSLSEVMKKHAVFFDIPVINIETDYYRQKEAVRLSDLMGTVDKDSDYLEVKTVLDEVNQSYLANLVAIDDKDTGQISKEWRLNQFTFYNDFIKEKFKEFSDLELEKRIEYMKGRIQEETENISKSTSDGKIYYGPNYGLTVTKKTNGGSAGNGLGHYNIPYENEINIKMEVDAGQNRLSETKIYDGDHISKGYTRHEGANSKYYNEINPLVEVYLDALKKNEQSSQQLAS